ncbi:hypothetical protein [Neobacillus sp. LXY-4]|uniref:hypothetical protein n=1 Tax=Neobacillus sp. LXY-4 TaxID=3379826 RepID=UPI003EE0709A
MKNISIRAIARELGVDSKTVKKYLEQPSFKQDQQKVPMTVSKLDLYKVNLLRLCKSIRNQVERNYVKLTKTNAIKTLYEQLWTSEKPIRITISLLGKRLGILAILERHLEKLPITKRLLEQITESVQQFQIRRCCKIIDNLKCELSDVKLWRVQRLAGIKPKDFKTIRPILEVYLQEGGIDEQQRYKAYILAV